VAAGAAGKPGKKQRRPHALSSWRTTGSNPERAGMPGPGQPHQHQWRPSFPAAFSQNQSPLTSQKYFKKGTAPKLPAANHPAPAVSGKAGTPRCPAKPTRHEPARITGRISGRAVRRPVLPGKDFAEAGHKTVWK